VVLAGVGVLRLDCKHWSGPSSVVGKG
jgi:hypothetical protein